MGPRHARPGGRDPPSKKVSGPKYDLVEVLRVARLARTGGKKSVGAVQDRLGLSAPEAEQFVRAKLQGLQEQNYAETIAMEYDDCVVVADVYGIVDEEGDWYFKFHIEHGQVQIVSCHEPLFELKCRDGTILKGR